MSLSDFQAILEREEDVLDVKLRKELFLIRMLSGFALRNRCLRLALSCRYEPWQWPDKTSLPLRQQTPGANVSFPWATSWRVGVRSLWSHGLAPGTRSARRQGDAAFAAPGKGRVGLIAVALHGSGTRLWRWHSHYFLNYAHVGLSHTA